MDGRMGKEYFVLFCFVLGNSYRRVGTRYLGVSKLVLLVQFADSREEIWEVARQIVFSGWEGKGDGRGKGCSG